VQLEKSCLGRALKRNDLEVASTRRGHGNYTQKGAKVKLYK